MTSHDQDRRPVNPTNHNDPAPGQSPRKRWSDDWGNFAILSLAIYLVLFLALLVSDWGSESIRTLINEVAFLPPMLLGIVFAARTARQAADPRARRAWWLIGLGFTFWLIGDAAWGYYEIVTGEVPFPSWMDIAYIVSVLLLIAGMLSFSTFPLVRSDRIRFWLDIGIITIGITALVGYLIIRPGLLAQVETMPEVLTLLAYPFSDALLLLCVFSVMVRRPTGVTISALSLLAGGYVIVALTDLWWTYLQARDEYVVGGVTYATWMIGQVLLVTGVQRQYDVVNRGVASPVIGRFLQRSRALMPYLAAVVAIAALGVAAVPRLFDAIGIFVGLLVLVGGLFVVRQVLTLRENARLRAEQIIRESEERFEALVQYSSDMMTVLDRHLRCRYQSPSATEIVGNDPSEFRNVSFLDWVHPDDIEAARSVFREITATPGATRRVEWRLVRNDGDPVHLETIVTNHLENPSVGSIVLNSRDITERKHLEAQLTFQAYHDSLTELPNRAMFLNAVVQALNQVEEGQGLALLFLDIDHFKLINDTLGHAAGDELLILVAQRLRHSITRTVLVGRLAGDEFTVLLTNVRSQTEARSVAERVLAALHAPVTVDGNEAKVTFSIGVAFTDAPGTDPADLLRFADTAMYAAKRNGRGRIEMFEPGMDDEMLRLFRDRALPEIRR